jgi:hypothetical protein
MAAAIEPMIIATVNGRQPENSQPSTDVDAAEKKTHPPAAGNRRSWRRVLVS